MKFALWPPSTQQSGEMSHSESQCDHATVSQASSWQKQTSSGPCMKACDHVRTHRQNLPSSEKAWASAESTTSSELHGHTPFREEEAAQTFVGQRSLERLFPGFTEDGAEHAALSASQSASAYKSSVDVARPPHLGPSLQPNRGFLT